MTYKVVPTKPWSTSKAFAIDDGDGLHVGWIYLDRGVRDGQRVMKVRNIEVNPKHQRKGLATKLYQAAAKAACEEGRVLVSNDRQIGAHSNDFWLKQAAKGRAIIDGCSKGQPVFVLRCFAANDLSGLRKKRKAPKKKRSKR